MSASKLQTIRLLNGLRMIHTERINGYNKAIALLGDSAHTGGQLNAVLSNFVRESIFFNATLENIVLIEGGKMPYGIKVDQQLYNISKELKSLFLEMRPATISACCRACENIFLSAYNFVLNEKQLAADPKDVLKHQYAELIAAQQQLEKIQGRNSNSLQAA